MVLMGEIVGTQPDDVPRLFLGPELRKGFPADMLVTLVALVIDPSYFPGLAHVVSLSPRTFKSDGPTVNEHS